MTPLGVSALTSLVVVLLVVGIAAVGCGSSADTAGTQTTGSSPTTAAGAAQSKVTITDQAGRKVTIPDPIKTVYCTSPMGTNLIYTLAPDMLVGWNISPTALEKEYIPAKYRNVVGLGGWFGKNTTGNVEEIIKRAPDVVLRSRHARLQLDLRGRPHPGPAQHPGDHGRR